jgi:hypothetical protein
VDDIPTPNLAKMARHILAGYYCDEICMIEDIDTIPLQTKFIENILSKRQKNKLLVVGSEVYNGSGDEGKFPISNMTAESYIFKSIINPDNLNIKDLYRSWINIKVYDHKESINNTPDPTGAGGFSDESLMRVLINKYNNIDNVIKITRNVNIHSDWIDRTWWNINTDKLSKDGYVCCNFLRPFSDNFDLIQPIVKHIFGENKEKNKVIL